MAGAGSQETSGRVRAFYPGLVALWFPLSLYAANADEVVFSEFLAPAAVAVGVALALQVTLTLLLRNSGKAALLASILALWFFSYSAMHEGAILVARKFELDFLASASNPVRHRFMLPAYGLVGLLAAIPVIRARGAFHKATRLANVVVLALIAITGAQLALAVHEIADSRPAGVPGASANLPADATRAEDRPDIYHLVFDRYANAKTLSDHYGFDNEPFLGALENLGFSVAREARSNYPRTILSLSSTLEMNYLPDGIYRGHLVHDIRRGHRVGRFLKERGYRYIHSGSWYGPTKTCDLADETLQLESLRSDFTTALLSTTVLSALGLTQGWEWDEQAEIAIFQFEQLERLPLEPGPRYVLAHILLPHPPFVFDHAGKRGASTYLEQLQFTNTRILSLLDRILTGSRRPVVVFLQADEGPYVPTDLADLTRREKLRLRSGVLYALRLPGGRKLTFNPATTPVNAFRMIFNECFDTDLELLENRVFAWKSIFASKETDIGPYEFEDVTSATTD